ncbi:hypothetical protein [Lysinibacillus fusiformis]|uniref:hypothetical protein n=1 Tax=Lysinibacillus fusiformis TaxID=28031 RepID=UPI003D018F03
MAGTLHRNKRFSPIIISKIDDTIYTHLLRSLWNNSKYESTLRELTPEEFEKYNERALKIEESDEVE